MKTKVISLIFFFLSVHLNAQPGVNSIDSISKVNVENPGIQIPNHNEGIKTDTSAIEFFAMGQKDAAKYYKKYKSGSTGILVSGIAFTAVLSLVPAGIVASQKPREANLSFPDPVLAKNADYHSGYLKKARKIKSGKVWTNWGIAFGINVMTILIIGTATDWFEIGPGTL